MKAIIYCFSGTGNTKRVSEFVKTELDKRDVETTVFSFDYESYKKRTYLSPNDFDIIAIAYPIYGFNAPYLVNRFVKALEKAKGEKQCFIIKTSGEPFAPNHYSSSIMKSRLRRKGYRVMEEKHYLMPYNIMFRYPDELVKQMYIYAESHAAIMADKIVNNEKYLLHPHPLYYLLYTLGKLVWIGGPIIGKTYRIKKKKCTKCTLCIKNCPMSNIREGKDGYPHFGCHCMICMRCVMYCPHDAINAGILNAWKVNGAYPFKKLLGDESVNPNYVNESTKGYFKAFKKYFDCIDRELKDAGLSLKNS